MNGKREIELIDAVIKACNDWYMELNVDTERSRDVQRLMSWVESIQNGILSHLAKTDQEYIEQIKRELHR